MPRWRSFEELVAQIHRALDSAQRYSIETDQVLHDDHGGQYQVDVVLRPRDGFQSPILISCKAWKDKVGVEHIREWSSVVANLGASAGIIVAECGFTREALREAKPSARRLSLWTPRPLTLDDYGPDEASPTGYIASVGLNMTFMEQVLKTETLRVNLKRSPSDNKKVVNCTFSKATREKWFLLNASNEVVGNAWDNFEACISQTLKTGTASFKPDADAFVVIDGVRAQFLEASIEVEMVAHKRNSTVNLLDHAIAYENAVTGEVRTVPLPPSALLPR
ncbi:MAG: restriction endonuclease [Nannocystaceae bacterium]|nr:restriction endonuclease [bacterium]